MVQMRRERDLLDVSGKIEKNIEDGRTRRRADVAEHGLKHCSLPSCDKREASVQQQILFRVSLRVVLLRGARGAALDGAQANLSRNHGREAGCRGGGRGRCLKLIEISCFFFKCLMGITIARSATLWFQG